MSYTIYSPNNPALGTACIACGEIFKIGDEVARRNVPCPTCLTEHSRIVHAICMQKEIHD